MADKQGITWGGVAKGIVKTAGYITVGIGIAAGASFGAAAIFGLPTTAAVTAGTVGTGTALGASLAGIPAMILDGIQAGTEWVANTFSGTFDFVGDLFSGATPADQVSIGGNAVDAPLNASDVSVPTPDAEVLNTLVTSANESLSTLVGEGGTLTKTVNQLTFAIQHVEAAGQNADGLREMLSQIQQLGIDINTGEAAISADSAIADLKSILDQTEKFALNEDTLLKIQSELGEAWSGLDKAGQEATQKALASLDAARDAGGEFIKDINNISHEFGQTFDPTVLENAPRNWAIAGGTILGAKAAHSLGRAKGQREVVGAFTEREAQRQAQHAQMAGLRNQLG